MPKKVIFFLHCIKISPSSKRRALDYESYLLDAGIKPCWVSYTPAVLYANFHTLTIQKKFFGARLLNILSHLILGGLIIVLRWASLIKLLSLCRRADAVFVQKVVPPRWYSKTLKLLNPNIAFDFDDAIFLRKEKRTEAIIRASKIVFAGSHYNFEFAKKSNRSVVLLPTPVPVERFAAKADFTGKKIVIGWIGSSSTIEALHLLPGVLERLAKKHPEVVLRIIGHGNNENKLPRFKNITLELVPRIPYEEVPDALAEFDIGIMPLLGSEWDKGKCAGKALEYMAASVPALVSRFGENEHVIRDGVNGFLASTEEEWFVKLVMLVEDRELRIRLGEAGRKTIAAAYSTKFCAQYLIGNLEAHLFQARRV